MLPVPPKERLHRSAVCTKGFELMESDIYMIKRAGIDDAEVLAELAIQMRTVSGSTWHWDLRKPIGSSVSKRICRLVNGNWQLSQILRLPVSI
ncbi:MAG: hypothetical protein IJH99_09200 [Eubacterium sp.]|nr:hypothetical protein [Eubacterium sp.]